MTLKVYDQLEQGSESWLEARRGILTASVIGKLITSTLKVANNETSRTIIRTLAAERITGHVEPVFVSYDMEFGSFVEPYVRDHYAEHYTKETVTEVGFMVRDHDGYRLGYSPDGLVGDDGLIEIKSRKPHIQLKAFLEDQVPAENMAQIQTGLLVSGRQWCDYISYCGDMPLYIRRITPTPQWQQTITQTLQEFEGEMNHIIDTYKQLTEDKPTTEKLTLDLEIEI